MLSRREAIAAMAAAAALPLMDACTRDRAEAPATSSRRRCARAARRVAEDLLRRYPESATSLGVDTGARAALRSQLADRSAEGQHASRRRSARTWSGSTRSSGRPLARHAHQPRGRAQRLCDGARRVRAAVRRHHGRRLAQHAVRRDPERRRVSRHSALSGQRSSHRQRRRRRGVSRPAAVATRSSSTASSAACRRRAPPGSCRRRS